MIHASDFAFTKCVLVSTHSRYPRGCGFKPSTDIAWFIEYSTSPCIIFHNGAKNLVIPLLDLGRKLQNWLERKRSPPTIVLSVWVSLNDIPKVHRPYSEDVEAKGRIKRTHPAATDTSTWSTCYRLWHRRSYPRRYPLRLPRNWRWKLPWCATCAWGPTAVWISDGILPVAPRHRLLRRRRGNWSADSTAICVFRSLRACSASSSFSCPCIWTSSFGPNWLDLFCRTLKMSYEKGHSKVMHIWHPYIYIYLFTSQLATQIWPRSGTTLSKQFWI